MVRCRRSRDSLPYYFNTCHVSHQIRASTRRNGYHKKECTPPATQGASHFPWLAFWASIQFELTYVPSKHLFWWTLTEDVFKTSSRRLQCNIFLSSKTSWRRLEDIIARRLANTSWRHLGRRKALRWRRLEVLKTSWKTRNVCWVKWRNRKMGFANVRTENTAMSNNNRWNYKIENLHTVVAYCCIIATTRKWDHVSLFLESK